MTALKRSTTNKSADWCKQNYRFFNGRLNYIAGRTLGINLTQNIIWIKLKV